MNLCDGWDFGPIVEKCGNVAMAFPHFFVEKFHTVSTLSTPLFFMPKTIPACISTIYNFSEKVGTQIALLLVSLPRNGDTTRRLNKK